MTVDLFSKRPWVVSLASRIGHLSFVFLLIASFSVWGDGAGAQQRAKRVAPQWTDSTGESDVYPAGDAVDVYRAVLDLLYVDGHDHPPYIILWDTATRAAGGPCTWNPCTDKWPHKSDIDSSTILAYARPSPKRPRIVDFGYRIKIVRVSNNDFQHLGHEGYGYLADRPPEKVGPLESFWAGFTHRYPKAWGYAMLSKVAFNPQHTQALIGVFQNCGGNCRSTEAIFLKRFGKQWRVIERIPDQVDLYQTTGNLRYRGPAGERADQSQVVAIDESGAQPRSDADDAVKVYTAVLDRLYSFYGESPRTLVLKETRMFAPGGLPAYRSRIDSATIAAYGINARIRDAVPRFRYRLPFVWLSDDRVRALEVVGAPLARAAAERFEDEQAPLWYGFHQKYPDAWGYLSLTRVGFNPQHTQALVSSQHACGSYCLTSDTWFLERKNNLWYIVERMPHDNAANWNMDGLRYLGPDADPKMYRPRRIQGVFTDEQTGKPLPRLKVRVKRFNTEWFFETDAAGRFALENLPLAPLTLFAQCPADKGGKWVVVAPVAVTPGMDSTMNAKVEFALCPE